MNRIGQYVVAFAKKWGSLVTGGILIGALGIWQGTGHPVDSRVYTAIAGGGLIISFFKAWEEQIRRAEKAEARIIEIEGRPELSLSCVEMRSSDLKDPTTWGAGSHKTIYEFRVVNGGNIQAVNVAAEPIVLPMSEQYKKGIENEADAFAAQLGEVRPEKQPDWDKWTVRFQKLTSLAPGREQTLAFTIDNMGPLQTRDLCFCLGSTVRPNGLGPLVIPMALRFSNRDGSTWVQRYLLEHGFKCHLELEFTGIEKA